MRTTHSLRRLLVTSLLVVSSASAGARIKDLVSVEGVRDNQLVGYGIVVGLNGTGDRQQTVFSIQSLTNVLERMGVTVPPAAIIVHNTAAVLVTGTLPPFAQPGAKIDVDVAAIGDATNLQGGLLVLTPLRASNGQVFAIAQGSVITGGFVAGRGGNSQTVNHPTVGRVVDGAIVEQSPPSVTPVDSLHLQLRRPDFSTASRISSAINEQFHAGTASALNSGLINVQIPAAYRGRSVEFIAAVDELQVDADRTSKISINERTGTVVFGGDMRIAPVAILQGNLSVQIQTTYEVSQPNALSSGQTQVVPKVDVGVKEDKAKDLVLKNGATVDELVRALVAIGSTPRDIIAILQSLKAAGALDAEIEVL
ncbi:MAG TPA: flagellar basal body P-ring protein FlgI [Bryobacteraceae bacterium]|jgi:flagellar P-ring protein precursor FlgI|nr:flagellar basal body P-ring protein FlgI [Bryobacteraceae bacterium]